MQIKIVEFGSQEYKECLLFRQKFLMDPIGVILGGEDLSRDPEDTHILALEHDNVIGCVIMHTIKSDVVKLRQLAVDEQFRGLGIGKKLVRFFEGEAIKKSARILR